jgi:hypothetical protein
MENSTATLGQLVSYKVKSTLPYGSGISFSCYLPKGNKNRGLKKTYTQMYIVGLFFHNSQILDTTFLMNR